MKLTVAAYVLTGLIVLISLVSIVMNCLILAEAGDFVNSDPAVTGVSLACSILLLAVCLAVCVNCAYVFTDKGLSVRFGAVGYRISYDDLLAVAADPETDRLYLQYRSASKKREYEIMAVNIADESRDAFLEELGRRNPDLSDSLPQEDGE